jgi:undecaprenyl-diphosphatase
VFATAGLVAALWIWGSSRRRGGLLAVGASLLLALAISTVIGALWYHPRPFVAGVGHALMRHDAETSFPSDHATFLWTVGFGLIAVRAGGAWGWSIAALGMVTAWARIYLGVHWPLDMAGSFLIACVSAAFAAAVHPFMRMHVLPLAERLYERGLDCLRLPAAAFPRRRSRVG